MPRIFLGEPAKASFEVSSIGDPNCGGLSRFECNRLVSSTVTSESERVYRLEA